jgi:hypothetical protein
LLAARFYGHRAFARSIAEKNGTLSNAGKARIQHPENAQSRHVYNEKRHQTTKP